MFGSKVKFETLEEFVHQFSDQIAKFNRKADVHLNDLLEFAVYEYSLQQSAQESPKLKVAYNHQIFISKAFNTQLDNDVIATFRVHKLFDIQEVKQDIDNYQPLFVLEAFVAKMVSVL